jgi:glycosyltransferase involved in cell wall biosynthesis
MPRGVELALVLPVHNEERYLPTAIDSLRTQHDSDVPVVFVNNSSTDGSAALLRQLAEVRTGQWTCIQEPKIGKFSAMAAGVDFCARQLGARHIGFLDADSYCAEANWLQTHAHILADARGDVGYIHSPYRYVGIEHLPTFAAAYHASAAVMHSISESVGWFANSAGSVFATAVLMPYFRTASITTELGLRCSLFALSEGQRAYFNPSSIMTSARRIVASAENLRAWCFYDRQFYLAKDINAAAKGALGPPVHLDDLPADMVGRFFTRQAIKFASRNLIPLALFDRNETFGDRLSAALGLDMHELVFGQLRPLRFRTDLVFTDQFEALLAAIERSPLTTTLAQRIESLMRAQHRDETGVAPPMSE